MCFGTRYLATCSCLCQAAGTNLLRSEIYEMNSAYDLECSELCVSFGNNPLRCLSLKRFVCRASSGRIRGLFLSEILYAFLAFHIRPYTYIRTYIHMDNHSFIKSGHTYFNNSVRKKLHVLQSGHKVRLLYRTCLVLRSMSTYLHVLTHTCTDNYVIFHEHEYVGFMCVCTNDASDMCISEQSTNKAGISLREAEGKNITSTEKCGWENWIGFYGIHRHVPTAGIQVGPRARMRAIVLI
jgi:hypothetical protein